MDETEGETDSLFVYVPYAVFEGYKVVVSVNVKNGEFEGVLDSD